MLISIILTFTLTIFADERPIEVQGIDISYHASELSITNQKAAKALFRRIPGERTYADLVNGLIFKYGEYLFCVREPDRKYHCHMYLNNRGEGSLSSYWKDHDYGKGSFFEFIEKDKEFGKATVSVNNGVLALYFEGKMASTFFERMDLADVQYLQDGEMKYEKRKGHNMNCVALEAENGDYHACRVYLPLEEFKKKEHKAKDLI